MDRQEVFDRCNRARELMEASFAQPDRDAYATLGNAIQLLVGIEGDPATDLLRYGITLLQKFRGDCLGEFLS